VCSAYGLATWGHLFTDRQIKGLLTISDQIRATHGEILGNARAAGQSEKEAGNYARTVVTFLALAADRCADFNNSLCRWSPSNQKVMNMFGKQALPMVWDFAEANLLGETVGAWKTCCDYVADCVEVLAAGEYRPGKVEQADAAQGATPIANLLVSTDPPYYDNIGYATLSDFFYVWLRRSIGSFHNDIFGTVLVPKIPELTASPGRFGGDAQKAKAHFETGFRRTFTSLAARISPAYPLTVYYAFKQEDETDDASGENEDPGTAIDLTTGWETMLEALISSGFQITATWPVRASQAWRMVSMGTNALASYIVLACRPRSADAPQIGRRDFLAELKRELPVALKHLQQGNVAPVDFAQASIGPGMAIYSRYSRGSCKTTAAEGFLRIVGT
jgi:putative DNA methylase